MLHQPTSTFTPSQAAPSPAQPFDTKRYLQRARELGVMVFPSIFNSGKQYVGYGAYPGYSFGQGLSQLAQEFDDDTAKSVIFDALCDDFGADPADPAFNEKVGAICHTRSRAHGDDDKWLIELCKRARIALEKDLAATNLHSELSDKLMATGPKRPSIETAAGGAYTESLSAAEMREKLPAIRANNLKSVVDAYRQRIATVVAYEKERARVTREIGLTRAKAAAERAAERARAVVEDVAGLPATTHPGLAHKAAILPLWDKAGYGLSHEVGEALAFSIAADAEAIGAGSQRTGSGKRRPSAQVHH